MKYYLAGFAITISVVGLGYLAGWLIDNHPMIFAALMAIVGISFFSLSLGYLIKSTKETYGGE